MQISSSFNGSMSPQGPIAPRHLALLLLGGDTIGLALCFTFVFWCRWGRLVSLAEPTFYGLLLLTLMGLYLADTYHPETQIAGLKVPARVLLGMGIVASMAVVSAYLLGCWGHAPLVERSILLLSFALLALWSITLRLFAGDWVHTHTQQSRWLMLVDSESEAQLGASLLAPTPQTKLVFLSDVARSGPVATLGSFTDVSVWQQPSWSGIVVSLKGVLAHPLPQELMQLRLQGTPIYDLTHFCERFWYKLPPVLLQDSWFVFTAGFNLFHDRISLKFKRLFDICLSVVLLVLLFPLMVLTALAIRLESAGPIFYSQVRTGLNNQPFRVYKFRSMAQNAEAQGAQWASAGDSRITRVGYYLRLLRIDELPQLWNVIQGKMSLIGPRPERPEFDVQLAEAIPYYNVRYLVKPGITGWAQVMYPYGASIADATEKLAYDLYYIKNYSIWLDIAIVFKTMRVVLLGKGR
jgi:exopolysaccharide biosynthesis polyprenyl glycosylphosphotransferase